MHRRLVNLRELAHLLIDSLPETIVRRNAYVAVRRALSANPRRFMPPTANSKPRTGEWLARKLAFPEIDLVVEGFPGSGNSYASNCLRAALGDDTRVTSHFHRRAQLQRAQFLRLPTIVLMREPLAACRSLKSKRPELRSSLILLRWLHYYRWLAHHGTALPLVLFESLVVDIEVLRRVPEVGRLLAGRPLRADPSLRRASQKRSDLRNDGRLHHLLLDRSRSLYRELSRRAVP